MARLELERNEIYANMRAKGMIPAKASIAAGYPAGSPVYLELETDLAVLRRIEDLRSEFEELRRAQENETGLQEGEGEGADLLANLKEVVAQAEWFYVDRLKTVHLRSSTSSAVPYSVSAARDNAVRLYTAYLEALALREF